jgi:hypothetical protein
MSFLLYPMFSISLQKIFITITISIILILSGHYLWNYLKNTYTEKKTKDLVGSQTQKYKTMLDEYIENNHTTNTFIPPEEFQSMDDDLTRFLQEQI